jgi:hypothetical protein
LLTFITAYLAIGLVISVLIIAAVRQNPLAKVDFKKTFSWGLLWPLLLVGLAVDIYQAARR